MTFARTVRLLAILAIVSGISAWRPSLFAQSSGQARQYDPAFDGAYASPASVDEGDWGDIPAYVSAVSGDARLERDGEGTSDFEQVPLQIGDQIRTTRGRVEVLYNDGSVLSLDEYAAVTVDADNTWRLHTGRMKVVSRSGTFAVDAAPVGVARLRGGGDYRITLAVNRRSDPEVELAVARGSAELENALGRTLVRPGTRALTTESYAPSVPYAYSAPRDEFERWTESLESDRYGVTSARYLPVELRAYGGDFDRDGYWSQHNSYGWVWYPRVAVGWEPFRSGRWSFVTGFGYNWIGGSRWEWPTNYYGRWDRYGSNWFWVPSRPAQWHRIGYSAPRRSFNASVSYYSRPQPNRSSPGYRGNANQQRSKIVEPQRDARRPSTSQDRVAIPRPSAINREPYAISTRPASSQSARPSASEPTRSSTFPVNRAPANRASDDSVFRTRQAPQAAPNDESPNSRPSRQTPQSGRPDVFGRNRQPSAQPSSSSSSRPNPSPNPSVEAPPRPSRGEARPPSAGGGRAPEPQRSSAGRPEGSRTPSSSPSSSSRPSSGTAVRRGGGR